VQESSNSGASGQQGSTATTGSNGQASNSASSSGSGSGSGAGSSSSFVVQAYSLQIEEFSATLQGNSGQATQAQTPTQSATAS
jgi:hypothetical protein